MNLPEASEFNKRVRIREWQDVPAIGTGIDQTVDNGVPAWASLTPTGAALFYGTQQVETTVTHRLKTWRTARVNALVITGAHVVEHAGIRYRVKRATDLDEDGAFVQLDLEQLGAIDG